MRLVLVEIRVLQDLQGLGRDGGEAGDAVPVDLLEGFGGVPLNGREERAIVTRFDDRRRSLVNVD